MVTDQARNLASLGRDQNPKIAYSNVMKSVPIRDGISIFVHVVRDEGLKVEDQECDPANLEIMEMLLHTILNTGRLFNLIHVCE